MIWPPCVKGSLESIDGRGFLVRVDPEVLIENIYVSPDSEPMFRDVVLQLARTYGLSASVHKSDVNAPPAY